ncbi:MAG TPA: hydroxymethylbilane synthase [Burkholderiales bacterium]|nr:hydroxymethylbilane synthase [Burkholderiales bacterium]
MKLTIATRRSRLALWQAEHVKGLLQSRGHDVGLLPLSTRGDELLDQRLDKVGGKGLFVKELESALADGRAALAVHSMKDLPAGLPPGFAIAAILEREDPRDAFVSSRYDSLGNLPEKAVVGTSSLRRAAQILERHPRLEAKLLRGNVETRLAKLDRGEYDAVILAVAGLVRLGLASRIRSRLDPDESLPAPGQGALGIECLASRQDIADLLAPLADAAAATCVRAERAVSRAFGGSCTIPLGAFAELDGKQLRLRALVAAADGRRVARTDVTGDAGNPEALGRLAAEQLTAKGAREILAS